MTTEFEYVDMLVFRIDLVFFVFVCLFVRKQGGFIISAPILIWLFIWAANEA